MIPVLGVPTLHRYDLLARMLASVDEPCAEIIVVDNGGACPPQPGAWVLSMPAGISVSAAWNLVLKATSRAPWWLFANDDVVFAPGDLARLAGAMDDTAPRILGFRGMAAFGITRACLETVGFFDENYHPAYVEDCDYEYRCKLAGVPIIEFPSGLHHDGSASIADPRWRAENDRTYPRNVAYHVAKWGGAPRTGERFLTPFDKGGSIRDWTLDIARLAELTWT